MIDILSLLLWGFVVWFASPFPGDMVARASARRRAPEPGKRVMCLDCRQPPEPGEMYCLPCGTTAPVAA